ncbi:MAG: biotin synthase [Methanoregulaceae archaeon PtaB.Bin056]|jgi:biotin synthase-related radical SAM superfamily protein|nr:MAG: biotin synthase [Methanoregulaceae archaeon PtaB.Bin056]
MLKARLLSEGTARLEGEPGNGYISASTAGPGAGGPGSVFFSHKEKRVRLALDQKSSIRILHRGEGKATLFVDGKEIEGVLEPIALHCPRQAYLTVSSGCIFSCRYCEVFGHPHRRKSVDEIVSMVERVADRIDAISLTSGVMGSVEEEEEYVLGVVRRLTRFGIPIGVSIYPTDKSAERLHALGVVEVKFNVETATDELFARMCPGLSRDSIWRALGQSVPLFGRNHVFSNLIIGLGETDDEVRECIHALTRMGVIPVIRPLTPAAGCKGYRRPSKERVLAINRIHADALREAGLDPGEALTMCVACTGCDLVPGRDDP